MRTVLPPKIKKVMGIMPHSWLLERSDTTSDKLEGTSHHAPQDGTLEISPRSRPLKLSNVLPILCCTNIFPITLQWLQLLVHKVQSSMSWAHVSIVSCVEGKGSQDHCELNHGTGLES